MKKYLACLYIEGYNRITREKNNSYCNEVWELEKLTEEEIIKQKMRYVDHGVCTVLNLIPLDE